MPAPSGGRLARIAPGIVMADGGEPVLGVVELTCDLVLDIEGKRGVRAEDEFAQRWHQGPVLPGQLWIASARWCGLDPPRYQ